MGIKGLDCGYQDCYTNQLLVGMSQLRESFYSQVINWVTIILSRY